MKNKIAYWGVFLALALVCSYVESLIPISFGIPGVKLGLTNIVVILMLYTIGAKDAILISVLRIILAGFMFGNAFSIIYSLAGGILSFVVMLLLKNTGKLKILSISTAGGISHNVGQLIVAALVVENYNILFYVPVLIIAGIITGFLIGLLAGEIVLRIGNRFKL
ncbi:MAG: Gx transporter family protein [Lachnobacterium sp.]|nr:Gx transporter family protein [Lachnobacterium sp.]MDD6632182.1 Gx transporter family protein [Lachnobacterium sp.]MDY2910591.1 Gx transporter family protein [Agathobacter sp.]